MTATARPRLPAIPDLPHELSRLLDQVPPGRTTTFGDLAIALGDLGAARWAAVQIAQWRATDRPWHRVLRRTGDLAAGTDDERRLQAERLHAEGARPAAHGPFTAFASTRPLQELADWQTATARQATGHEPVALPDRIGAVDLSYASETDAVAAYVACDTRTLAVVDRETCRVPVAFPYIPGYLTFRELPALLTLVQRVGDRIAPVLLVDGSGRLHPRRFGIAVALGVLTGLCTVGVAKHRLCGQPLNPRPTGDALLADGGEPLGYRLDGGSARRTLYVSPGHQIDLASAGTIVRAVWRDRRSPEPIHWADRLSRSAIQELHRDTGSVPPRRLSDRP